MKPTALLVTILLLAADVDTGEAKPVDSVPVTSQVTRYFDRGSLDEMLAHVERPVGLPGGPVEPDTVRYTMVLDGKPSGDPLWAYNFFDRTFCIPSQDVASIAARNASTIRVPRRLNPSA